MNGLIGYGRMGSRLAQIIPMEYIYGREHHISLENWPKLDVLFDFSNANRIEEIIEYVSKNQCKCILGTSNYSEDVYLRLKKLSNNIPIVFDENYSIGIQLIKRFIEENQIYIHKYDIEIIESHHKQKKDKPSGTANILKACLKSNKVNIHSLRAGNTASSHEIILCDKYEQLNIKHQVNNLDCFMEGIQMAYEFIQTKEKGWYTMADVLKEKIRYEAI